MDENNEVLSALPKTTQSSESRSVEMKHKDHDIDITSSNICCVVAMSLGMRKIKGYPCSVLRVVIWLES